MSTYLPNVYVDLSASWQARMEYLMADDASNASAVWGEAFRKYYGDDRTMIAWHHTLLVPGRSDALREYADCTIAGVMYFEDTVGRPV